MSEFALDWEAVADRIADFVRGQIHGAGRERGIIGLSGGIDSAVSAYMAVRALGPENFTAFMMPYRTSSPSSLEDALLVVGELGVEWTRFST